MSEPLPSRLETSLGPDLVRGDGGWRLSLLELPVLHGLSVLSRALAEMLSGQARSERVDIAVERKLRPRENPELIERFRIDHVKAIAEPGVGSLAPELLERRLRSLLGSLQRPRYREALFPEAGPPRALVAEFDDLDGRQRYVLEHLAARREAGRGALRITIEDGTGRRLDLATLPHLDIAGAADRHFIAGSTRIAQTWTEALRRECARGRRSFVEQRDPHSHLFRQLDQAGLGELQRVALQWSESALPVLLENEPAVTSELLKRVLLALEDGQVRRLLAQRQTVLVEAGPVPVYLDIAQIGRVLCLSLGQRRPRVDADAFLARMPVLHGIVERQRAAAPLRSISVFLVHHMTAEVVGLIAALRALGCRDLTCLFVTYAGEPPASYLDAVLDLPGDEFRALALVNVPHPGSVEGCYRLSPQYSRLAERDASERALQRRGAHYLDAMRAAAIVPFLGQVEHAAAAGRRLLLIEDGGYLAPVLNDALLRGATVGAFAATLGHECVDDRALTVAVGQRLLGTVEHTRNGFDRLAEVQRLHGRLFLPAWSIAISRLKREVESREVAASILGAVEAVLNADGRILARRCCLVLGAGGAIGRELCRALAGRLDDPVRALAGIDLAAGAPAAVDGSAMATTLAGLPADRWLDTDLVLGVTGDSVLGGADLERWLLHGRRDVLVLASGSTKKIEFRGVMQWFEALLQDPRPRLGGVEVAIEVGELIDPRTSRVYGQRWIFRRTDGGATRQVLALGGLMPINFLFYAVATELIDEVLAQLCSLALGAVRVAAAGAARPELLAVDRDVDGDARPLVAAARS